MSFLQRTGRRFAAFAVMVACFAASSAFAAMLATNDFETSFADFTTDETLASLATYNGDGPSGLAAYPFEDFGSKYLAVDSDTNMLWRSFGSRSANTYFDSYVQFTPMYGDFECPDDAKFAIFLDSATSNLCVVSGTSANDPTPVTNRLTTALVEPNSWGRLTVSALSGDVFSFQIRVNGTLFTAGGTDTFYSMAAGTTLSEVGFSGTGALDNFVVRTTDPFFSGTVAATIGGENGEKYASLEATLAEADADTVVTLAADHAEKVYLADAATYKIDNSGGHVFGGVVGANGYKVTAGEPVAGVTTYTATDAFASQPSPVVVWDGASENYDFSTLTRTVGGATYTMAVNDANATINSAKDYITVGSENQKWTVKITADAAGAFGSTANSGFTVIAKVANAGTSESSNRAILNYYTSSTQAGATFAHTPTGCAFPMVNDQAYLSGGSPSVGSRQSVAGTLKSDGTIQTLALSYGTNPQGGTAFYVDGELIYEEAAMTSGSFTTPEGLTLGGVPIDNSSKLYALKGMKVYAVALFNTKLTNEQVAAFAFPSSRIAEDIAVSEINAIFGSAGEIWLDVADGVTITGDTAFNASTIHFASAGEVVLYPPAGNAATLDFSGVAKPVVAYNGVLPTQSGSTFTSTTVPTGVTDAAQWTGTVWVKNYNGITADNFNPNNLGNVSSTLRLTMIRGYLKARQSTSVLTTTFNPAIELDDDGYGYSLCIHDAYSYGGSYNEYTVFRELKGDGTFVGRKKDDGNGGPYALFQIQNWDHFTGTISLTNQIISFGATIPAANEFSNENYGRNGGLIFVMPDATVTIPSGKTWYAANTNYTGYTNGSIIVKGELRVTGVNQIDAASIVTTTDTGTFTLTSTGNGQETETDTSYARITGTGSLKYEGMGWRALSSANFPTNMTLMNEQAGDLLLSRALTYTIGSFAGSKNLQGNYGSGDRYLRVLQTKDTEWSGKIKEDGYSRFKGLTVAPGESTAGTLTLSGTQTQSATLTVESGAMVNLTGTWVGPVTVAGTFGGTGTVSGGLTLSDGAVIKVDDRTDTVSVNNLTVNGTVSVYLPASAVAGDTFLSTSAMPTFSNAAFKIYVGETLDASLRVIATSNGLKIAPKVKGAKFFFH